MLNRYCVYELWLRNHIEPVLKATRPQQPHLFVLEHVNSVLFWPLYNSHRHTRVLSRIYCLGEKSRVAEGHEPPRGGRGGSGGMLPPEIFGNEYALRCNVVHFETQF